MPAIKWFAYNFPNRRVEMPVVEIRLNFSSEDRFDPVLHTPLIKKILVDSGILAGDEVFPRQALPDDQIGCYTSLLVQTALLFQRRAGHRVSFFSTTCFPDQNRSRALLEHDHGDVGLTAVKLAYELVNGQRSSLAEPFRAFREYALQRLLPRDSEAIIKAARRCDIPVIRLEHLPYKRDDFDELTRGECIRRNGLLMLGHGKHQHVLDGTFCLDLSAGYNDLRVDAGKRQALLKRLGVPVLKPDNDGPELRQYRLIAVNGQVSAVVNHSDGETYPPAILGDELLSDVLKINCEVGFAPIVVHVLSADISCPGSPNDAYVTDFELAPELDRCLDAAGDAGADLLNSTADMIIDWLFHGKDQTRMPIVAITGTNGKTTTTRMINHIYKSAGLKSGMVCTEGVYLDGEHVTEGDMGTVSGHLQVLTNREMDVAVLETHHGGINANGFAFRWCDVAICLNVTEDHLGTIGIDTLEQMAELKQALPQRARKAAVLNADNRYSLGMVDAMRAERTCLVSMKHGVDELRTMGDKRCSCFCVIESTGSGEWLVIYDRQQRIPVMGVNSIPVTFDGAAAFNTSNAMHAVLAAYLMGVRVDIIRAAMGEFHANSEMTPGRLNRFDNLPFPVIMDYAHNPDGLRRLSEFVDRQEASGRKVIAFAGSADRTDEQIRNTARAVAGHFDYYFCKEYTPDGKRAPRPTAHILQQELLECGVADEMIVRKTHGREVIFEILDSCQPGDLLIMAMGNVEKFQLAGFIDDYIDAHPELFKNNG